MLYAILCYNNEDEVFAWSNEQGDAVMARINAVESKLNRQGRMGPSARLMPTSAATTLRKNTERPLIFDGPFAETKEQLLGFFVVECANLDEALSTASELAHANSGASYEVRPILLFNDRRVGRND